MPDFGKQLVEHTLVVAADIAVVDIGTAVVEVVADAETVDFQCPVRELVDL